MFGKQFFKLTIIVCFSCFQSCENKSIENDFVTEGYAIINGVITHNKNAIQLIGANTLHTFSVGSSDLKTWNIDIAREFVGNVKENPITGNPILDTNNKYLYSLQNIVNDNRNNGLITILCPFGWDGTTANLYTGKSPTATFWWNDYKNILQQWAVQFKDQNDVWIEVWNEPYNYDRTDGYTDQIWLNNMNELYNVIRSVNNNIVLIPCAEQGQDESVLINVGTHFLSDKNNVLFDVHAYEKWLLSPNENIQIRLQALIANKLPVIFGETAPMNAGILMNPKPFLDKVYDKGLSVCAWLWKYDENDQDALLRTDGSPNNNNNNNWGTNYKNLALQERNLIN